MKIDVRYTALGEEKNFCLHLSSIAAAKLSQPKSAAVKLLRGRFTDLDTREKKADVLHQSSVFTVYRKIAQ